MRSRFPRYLLILFIVCSVADIAQATILGSAFSFRNSWLNGVFLFPFRYSGCVG